MRQAGVSLLLCVAFVAGVSPAVRGETNITRQLKERLVVTAGGNPHVIGGGWFEIVAGGELVVKPGVEIRFSYDPRHQYGGYRSAGIAIRKGGRLLIEGSAAQPVVLTSYPEAIRKKAEPIEDWHGISIEEGGSASISNAVFRYTRSPAINVGKGASGSVQGCTFERGGTGLVLREGSGLSTLERCRFHKGTSVVAWATERNVQVASCSGNQCEAGMHVAVGHFDGPGTYKLGLPGEAGKRPLPYYISSVSGLAVGSEKGRVELTIEAGTMFKAQASRSAGGTFYHSGIRVHHGASLQVMGKSDAPVVFTPEPDDTGKKAAGRWGGIVFEKTCGTAQSRVQHAVLEYGASEAYPASRNQYHAPGMITVYGGDVTVLGCTFRYAGGAGLHVAEAQPKVTDCQFLDNQIGLGFENVKLFRVSGCKITGSKVFGATCNNCNDGKVAVDLTENWWGDASGPLDASDDRQAGGGHNPTGKGDKVSDYIRYKPWYSSPAGGTTPPPDVVKPEVKPKTKDDPRAKVIDETVQDDKTRIVDTWGPDLNAIGTPTLLVDSIAAPTGETITVTVSFGGVDLLRSMNWELHYDAKVLQVVKVRQSKLLTLAGALFQHNAREAGRIRFGFADKEGVRPGPLAHVDFRIIGPDGSQSPLTLTDAKASGPDGKPVVLTLQNGTVSVKQKTLKGDENGDGLIDVRDAMAALMMSVGNRKEDPILDMDDNGKVEARDAELILRLIVGK